MRFTGKISNADVYGQNNVRKGAGGFQKFSVVNDHLISRPDDTTMMSKNDVYRSEKILEGENLVHTGTHVWYS